MVKKILAKYQINIQSLDEKRHEYDFDGGSDFFESFEQDIISGGKFEADVQLIKNETMMRLNFHIKGFLNLTCDRSLEEFEDAFDIEEQYVYKFGDDYEEVSEDMEIIPFGTSEINVAKNIFEYIFLAIPVKKLHPKYRDEDLDEDFIFTDKNQEEESQKIEDVDPRWAALQALKKDL